VGVGRRGKKGPEEGFFLWAVALSDCFWGGNKCRGRGKRRKRHIPALDTTTGKYWEPSARKEIPVGDQLSELVGEERTNFWPVNSLTFCGSRSDQDYVDQEKRGEFRNMNERRINVTTG